MNRSVAVVFWILLSALAFAPQVSAQSANVGLIACENTMTNTKVTRTDMTSGITYVTAGVTHIMKRQREGWAYVRP